MKSKLIFLLAGGLLSTMLATAAQPPANGMSPQDMQAMMGKMQEMQACMQNVDYASMQQLEQRSQQIRQRIESLCASGDSAAATSAARDFAGEIMQHPAMAQIKKCRDIMLGMPMMPQDPLNELEQRYTNSDICASMQ